MTTAWTRDQDDQAAFEEAMDVADISVRRLEAQVSKLRQKIERLHQAQGKKGYESMWRVCLAMCDGISSTIQTPYVTQWRQEHSEGRGKRHAQQHILEVKLAFARDLLIAHGVDLDAELAKRRLGS